MPPEDFYECMLLNALHPFIDMQWDRQAGITEAVAPKSGMQQAEDLHAKFMAFKINRELKKQPS